jgi:hypothetical protein
LERLCVTVHRACSLDEETVFSIDFARPLFGYGHEIAVLTFEFAHRLPSANEMLEQSVRRQIRPQWKAGEAEEKECERFHVAAAKHDAR